MLAENDALLLNKHWEEAFIQLVSDDFYSWEPLYELDFREGNPIFSLYHPASRKAVRVLHEEAPGRYGMYMRKSGTAEMVGDDIDELVFSSSYDKGSTEIFRLLSRVWLHPATDYAYMDELIARMKNLRD